MSVCKSCNASGMLSLFFALDAIYMWYLCYGIFCTEMTLNSLLVCRHTVATNLKNCTFQGTEKSIEAFHQNDLFLF
jgi:hypothetical protein